jgi:guanine nucleotide-binding protein G(i) subunit alpha
MGIPLGNLENQSHIEAILAAPNQIEGDILPPRIAAACKMLWADAGVQTVYVRKNEIQLNDSAR